MAIRQDIRDVLDLARRTDVIDEMDFQLMYNVNRVNRSIMEFPCWQYERFDLERLADDERKVEVRLKKNIYDIVNVLQIPDTYNRLNADPVDGMCILLKRFA